jgi:hypothetical protein
METLVCLLRTSQAREHSHRPKPTSVHGGLNPSGEGIDTWETNLSGIVNVFGIFRGVKTFDFQIGDSGKPRETFWHLAEDFRQILFPPFLLLFDLFQFIFFEHAVTPYLEKDQLTVENGCCKISIPK